MGGPHVLNIGGDAKLDSLRATCDSIAQLGLDTVNLIDTYMLEGPSASQEVINERKHPNFADDNHAYYLENP